MVSLGGLLLQVCLHGISKCFIPTTSPFMVFLLGVDWIRVQSPLLAFFDGCFAIIKNCSSPQLIGPIAFAIDPNFVVADFFWKHLAQVTWDVELHVILHLLSSLAGPNIAKEGDMAGTGQLFQACQVLCWGLAFPNRW